MLKPALTPEQWIGGTRVLGSLDGSTTYVVNRGAMAPARRGRMPELNVREKRDCANPFAPARLMRAPGGSPTRKVVAVG